MVDNQHKKIKGYRDLTEEEIALMNETKDLASKCGDFCQKLHLAECNGSEIDRRWLAIAKTDLQKGFMSLVRSVAKPESF
jgi:hypothetical protein